MQRQLDVSEKNNKKKPFLQLASSRPHYQQSPTTSGELQETTQATQADQSQFMRSLRGIFVIAIALTCSYIFKQEHVSYGVVYSGYVQSLCTYALSL